MRGSSKGHPIVQRTVSAADSADDLRLQAVLAEISSNDPALRINTQQQGISHSLEGSSTSHLESICNHLRGEHHLAINVGPIEAVLLETIRQQSKAEGKFIRQMGGRGNYGHCWLRIEPNKPGGGYEFTSTASGDLLPDEYVDAINRGIQHAMETGVGSGRHLVDLKVTVIDGSFHTEDSNPLAFEIAGSTALQNAVRSASRVLLEPVMAVEIEVPERLATPIRSEIFMHRGRIKRQRIINSRIEIAAIVPLSELLSSTPHGLAEFPTQFAGYEPVSDDDYASDNGPGVTANKPNFPRHGMDSEMARPEPEDE